jgi:protease IV
MPLPENQPIQKVEVVLKKPIFERIGSFLWLGFKVLFVFAIIAIIIQGQKLSNNVSKGTFQSFSMNEYFQEEEYDFSAIHVGFLTLSGQISDFGGPFSVSNSTISTESTIAVLEEMASNEDLDAILIRVDSPGGEVLASRKIADMISYINTNQKPVYVLMETIATSGGYYISAPAEKIYAYPETLLGNIGVRIDIPNIEQLLGKIGVEMQSVTSGNLKDMGSPYRKMTEEERSIFDTLINESYQHFLSVVAQGRNMSVEEVRILADGRIYSGLQAEKNGLIDDLVFSLSDVARDLKKEVGKSEPIQFIEYRRNITPWEEILMSVSSWGESFEAKNFLNIRFLAQ